jgi:hypothetical protein
MRYIFDLKSWGMLLLRTGFVNYFNQEVFAGNFRMKRKEGWDEYILRGHR